MSAWTTPRILRAFVAAIWFAAALLLLVSEATMARARRALFTMQKSSAPNIIAAQEIASDLADLDANAANYLLEPPGLQSPQVMETFELRRQKVTRRLVDAAQNINFGDEERLPVLAMFEQLGRYLELAGQARYLHDHGDAPGALGAYLDATATMHNSILPAAAALDHANRSYMDLVYLEQRQASGFSELLVGLCGVLLVLALVAAQLFLRRRMRRIFNPLLVVATVTAIGFVGFLEVRFRVVHENLREAKEDAFESIHKLWLVRAAAFDANGDESRLVLDGERAKFWADAFQNRQQQLASVDAQRAVKMAQQPGPVRFNGLFADELRNITYAGEREAALTMISEYASYVRVIDQVTQRERSKPKSGVPILISTEPGQASWAFDRFDKALAATVDINDTEFNNVLDSAEHGLAVGETADPIVLVLVAALAWLGVRPRLREYRA
jgi:hypothetical protein